MSSSNGDAILFEDFISPCNNISRLNVWTKAHIKMNVEPVTSSVGEAFVRAIFLEFVDLLFYRLIVYVWVTNVMLLV